MNYISGIAAALLSVAVSLLMANYTNRLLKRSDSEEYAEIKPFAANVWGYLILAGICALSAVCGWTVGKVAVNKLAILQMMLCYLAILASAVVDYKLRIIPNFIPGAMIAARVLIFAYEFIFLDAPLSAFYSPLLGCLLCLCFMLVGNKLSKGGIGGGDIKLLAAIGLMSGAYSVVFTLLYGLMACSVFAIFVTLTKKMTLKQSVPFGPFIYLGFIVVCLTALY